MKLHTMLSTAALMASLTLSGAAIANEPAAAADAAKKPHRMEETVSKLPEAKQKIVREAMEKARAQNKELWAQSKKLRDEHKAILTAEKFDKAAYLAKAKEMSDLRSKMADNRNEAFASIAGQLTPEERLALVRHGGARHGKGGEAHPKAAQ
jgi:Spy/CpxP family protein refolding chaperone